MQELAIDGNMVATKKGYTEFCLTSCPNLKQLDLKKVTPEMRDQNGVAAAIDDKKNNIAGLTSDSTAIDTDSYLGKMSSVQPSLAASTSTNHGGPNVNVTHTAPGTHAA